MRSKVRAIPIKATAHGRSTGRIHISDFREHALTANGSRSIHSGRDSPLDPSARPARRVRHSHLRSAGDDAPSARRCFRTGSVGGNKPRRSAQGVGRSDNIRWNTRRGTLTTPRYSQARRQTLRPATRPVGRHCDCRHRGIGKKMFYSGREKRLA